jgi:hypothetical protein
MVPFSHQSGEAEAADLRNQLRGGWFLCGVRDLRTVS